MIWPATPSGRGLRQVHVAAFLDGLAAVHGFEHGQLAGLLLDDAGDAIEIFAALATGHPAPDLLVSAARGFDGQVHVRRGAQGNLAQLRFGGGIDGIKVFASGRRDEFAVNEQLVPGRDFDVVEGLGCRCIIPLVAEVQPAVFEGNDGMRRGRGPVEFGEREGAGGFGGAS